MFSWDSSFYLEAVPMDRCSGLMKFNETCSSWLISKEAVMTREKGLYSCWEAQAFNSFFFKPWRYTPRKIPERPQSGPRTTTTKWHECCAAQGLAHRQRSSCRGSSVSATTRRATPTGQHQKQPMSWEAGRSPACVSLKPLLRILGSEHPFIPYTKNTEKVIRHKGEVLTDYRQLLCSPPYTCAIIILLCVHLIFITSKHGKNPNPFRINSLLKINFSFCQKKQCGRERRFFC